MTRNGFQDISKYWCIGTGHAGLTDTKSYLDRGRTATVSNATDYISMWRIGTMLQERRHWLTYPSWRTMKLYWVKKDAIAKWFDRRYEDHAKIMKTLKQRTGQTLMFSFLLPVDTSRQYNSSFQTRLQEVRWAALTTSSNMVDGDQSSEEPQD